MKLFIFLLLFYTFKFSYQSKDGPAFLFFNRTDIYHLTASGDPETEFDVDTFGFDDVEAAFTGFSSLNESKTLNPVGDPCITGTNVCLQECKSYGDGVYQCLCSKGYKDITTKSYPPSSLIQTGLNCTDIDECLTDKPCGDAQTDCKNTIGSYNCSCDIGYEPSEDGTFCTDYDECKNETLNNCHQHADCINIVDGFECKCKEGFEGDGLNCTDIDECLVLNITCGSKGDCVNTIGSYSCDCYTGFTEDRTNSTPICIDINECDGPQVCFEVNTECKNTFGRFECPCKTGFSDSGDDECKDIDECSNDVLNNCNVNANCENTEGSYNCKCKNGFLGDGIICDTNRQVYCFRGQIHSDIENIRSTGGRLVNTIIRAMDSEMQRYSRLGLGFYQTGYTLTVEDAKDDRILAVNICFRAISFVREKLGKLFIDFPPTSQMNGNNWNITDFDECKYKFIDCDDDAICENFVGDADCKCPENRYDKLKDNRKGRDCGEPIKFECLGTRASVSLHTKYWYDKFIDVKDVFVNDGCAGDEDGDWYVFDCAGKVTANDTDLISTFNIQDVVPEGAISINRIDLTFHCIQPTQQNFTSNITSEDNIIDPGIETIAESGSSIIPKIFSGGFDVAAIDGVKTGDLACVELSDPNIPDDIKIMVEELHTSAPGSDKKFTLVKDYCTTGIRGIKIETSPKGICFTMHRPQGSKLLEVHLMVNLCSITECPKPECGRKRRSLTSRQKRSEELQAISFLIKIPSEDLCDRDCGVGACILDFLNQKQCICPQRSFKQKDGTCAGNKLTNTSNGFDEMATNGKITIIVLIVLGIVFVVAVSAFIVLFARRRHHALVNDKQLEMKGVYTNSISPD